MSSEIMEKKAKLKNKIKKHGVGKKKKKCRSFGWIDFFFAITVGKKLGGGLIWLSSVEE